jgi:hypothetical protein
MRRSAYLLISLLILGRCSAGVAQTLIAPGALGDEMSEPWAPAVTAPTLTMEETLSESDASASIGSPLACDCGSSDCQCPESSAEALPAPRINLINPAWQLMVGGTMELDMFYNTARPVAAGEPFFLSPGSPFDFDTDTFDAHSRQSNIYAVLVGPEIGEFQAGGYFLANFFNDSVIQDRYGFLPINTFGELKNSDWRMAAGLQSDIFAPLLPTVLPFSYLAASGNAGVYRGQLRIERFIRPNDAAQLTVTTGLSEPIATTLNNETLSEDNGWPNVEGRAAVALGPETQVDLVRVRPFEIGVSGFVGQLRTVSGATRAVANAFGIAGDFRWRINDKFGIAGEVYSGQAMGTYGAGVFQNVNAVTFEPIHATGGWGEIYVYWTSCLHTHTGYGIDDPLDSEVAPSQIAENSTLFGNVIWDISKSFRVALEATVRRTDYETLLDNDGVGLQSQFQWKF